MINFILMWLFIIFITFFIISKQFKCNLCRKVYFFSNTWYTVSIHDENGRTVIGHICPACKDTKISKR